jgi:hypothetical protein
MQPDIWLKTSVLLLVTLDKLRKVQLDAQVDKNDKSGYASMNDKLSCKFSTSFLRSAAIENKMWRFY